MPRGWQGNPPKDDDDARNRITYAAMLCASRKGPNKTGIADVAKELGITRQTVYRHFASMDELWTAVSYSASDAFVDRVVVHCSLIEDPVDAVIESMAFVVEELSTEPYLLLATGRRETFEAGIFSSLAIDVMVSAFQRISTKWAVLDSSATDLNEFAEFALSVLYGLLSRPEQQRSAEQLREFLRRWVGPPIRATLIENRSLDR